MAIKARGEITLSSVVDVKAVYRYYLLQSSTLATPSVPTSFPPSSWDDTEPTYTTGSTNSLYTVDCTVFSDDTFVYSSVSLSSSYEAAKVAYNKAENAVSNTIYGVDVMYALSTSSTTAPTSGWQTTAPTWVDGEYMWQKTVVTYGDGKTTESDPTCISGATGSSGATGADGNGVSSIVEQYYQSTSATELSGGSWVETTPTWVDGMYIWTRSVITYTDGTSTTTAAVCVTGATGATGVAGATGADGKTSYLHIKYSDDGETFTANDGEELGAWIGTLVDFTEADSTTFSDYTWKKFTEDVDEELEDIRNTIVEKTTSVLNDCESIIMTALESYVETGDYETFKKDVEAELKVVSNKITMDFTTLTDRITTVEGDAQSKLAEIYKHIQFDDDGITIGSSENAITMNLDNDQLVFSKNGVEIVRLDIDNFTPTNVYIKSGGRLKLGNFAWEVLETGVPVFMKVGE